MHIVRLRLKAGPFGIDACCFCTRLVTHCFCIVSGRAAGAPSHLAAATDRADCLQALLSSGLSSPDERTTSEGFTPLMLAATADAAAAAAVLLQAGAALEARNHASRWAGAQLCFVLLMCACVDDVAPHAALDTGSACSHPRCLPGLLCLLCLLHLMHLLSLLCLPCCSVPLHAGRRSSWRP